MSVRKARSNRNGSKRPVSEARNQGNVTCTTTGRARISIMRNALILTAATLVCGSAPAASAQVVTRTGPATEHAGSSDIALLRDAYVAAINAGDMKAVAALYADDAVLVPSDGVALRGHAEIATYLARTLGVRDSTRAVTITCLKSESGEKLGSETGRFEEAQMTAAGTLTRVTGVYVIIYSRGADGAWRVAIEVRTRGGKDALVDW
jgi:ketosteroid isomerase-like protein